jgi:hypothetical protein
MPEIEEKSVGFWVIEIALFLAFLYTFTYFSKTKTIKKLAVECLVFTIPPLVLSLLGLGWETFLACLGLLSFVLFINLCEVLKTPQEKLLGSLLPAGLFILSLKSLDPYDSQLNFWERILIMCLTIIITSSFFITQIIIRMRREKEGMKKELQQKMTGGGVVRG